MTAMFRWLFVILCHSFTATTNGIDNCIRDRACRGLPAQVGCVQIRI
jgi:hypothetical protein